MLYLYIYYQIYILCHVIILFKKKNCLEKKSLQRDLTYSAVNIFGPQLPRYIESTVYIVYILHYIYIYIYIYTVETEFFE
jgi:hypothetical protein